MGAIGGIGGIGGGVAFHVGVASPGLSAKSGVSNRGDIAPTASMVHLSDAAVALSNGVQATTSIQGSDNGLYGAGFLSRFGAQPASLNRISVDHVAGVNILSFTQIESQVLLAMLLLLLAGSGPVTCDNKTGCMRSAKRQQMILAKYIDF